MNKQQLVRKVAEQTGQSQVAVYEVLTTLCNVIADTVASGDDVRLVGFGAFTKRTYRERIGRNPKTGSKLVIPAKQKLVFVAGLNTRKTMETSK